MKSGENVQAVVLKRFFYENQPAHCSYRPLISKKQILIANELCAAKYYLSG
jgi:hypothetical protein